MSTEAKPDLGWVTPSKVVVYTLGRGPLAGLLCAGEGGKELKSEKPLACQSSGTEVRAQPGHTEPCGEYTWVSDCKVPSPSPAINSIIKGMLRSGLSGKLSGNAIGMFHPILNS